MTFETTKNKLQKLWQKSIGTQNKIEKTEDKNAVNTGTFKSFKSNQTLIKRIRELSPDWVQMNTLTETVYEDSEGVELQVDDFCGKFSSETAGKAIEREAINTLYYSWRIELGDMHEDHLIFLTTEFLFNYPTFESESEVDFNLIRNFISKNVYFETHDIPDLSNIVIGIGETREDALKNAEPDKDYPIKHVFLCANIKINATENPPNLPETEVKLLIQVINKNIIQ